MADYGLKIAKAGSSVSSTDPDDYILWTKYPPLTFLEKKTTSVISSASNYVDTHSVPHDYDFFPLVLGYVTDDGDGDRYKMPADGFASLSCDFGLIQSVSFNYTVYDDRVDISWRASCALMGSEEGPLNNEVFTIELYFYMWELGSTWP